MTTNKVVADGGKESKGEKSPAEIRGLVQVKANELTERILRESLELGVVLDGMQLLIEGLDIKDEMVFTPLEWSEDLGEFTYEEINGVVMRHCPGWRLPTDKELIRALRSWTNGFLINAYYWSSTSWTSAEGGKCVTRAYDRKGGLAGCSSNNDFFGNGQKRPRLRLCRPKPL